MSTPMNCPAHFAMHEVPCPYGCVIHCVRQAPALVNAELKAALSANRACVPFSPMHASAATGYQCATCMFHSEACPTCYKAWWKRRHLNHFIDGEHGVDIAPEPAWERVGVPAEPTMGQWDDFCAVFPVPFDKFQAAYKAMFSAKPTAEPSADDRLLGTVFLDHPRKPYTGEPSAQPADAQAGDGMCGCKNTADCHTACHGLEHWQRPKNCRIAAGQPFSDQNGCASNITSEITEKPQESSLKHSTDPVSIDDTTAFAEHVFTDGKPSGITISFQEGVKMLQDFRKRFGTRLQGLKDARKMLQENGCSCLVDDALEQAIAALSACEKKPAHGGPVDGAGGN